MCITNNKMKRLKITNSNSTTTITLLATCLIAAGSVIIISYGYLEVKAYTQGYKAGNYTFGVISSIQNDENGNPAWLVAGHWKTNLLSNQSSSNDSSFNAQVEMVNLDGTSAHTHTITNFVLANMSQPDNMTKVLNGTSTASMREGPVTDIPTSITIMGGKVISIQLDPSKIDKHFGNTPIYGLVMDERRSVG